MTTLVLIALGAVLAVTTLVLRLRAPMPVADTVAARHAQLQASLTELARARDDGMLDAASYADERQRLEADLAALAPSRSPVVPAPARTPSPSTRWPPRRCGSSRRPGSPGWSSATPTSSARGSGRRAGFGSSFRRVPAAPRRSTLPPWWRGSKRGLPRTAAMQKAGGAWGGRTWCSAVRPMRDRLMPAPRSWRRMI